jgi:hypothetical protein
MHITNLPAGEITVELCLTGFEERVLKIIPANTLIHQIFLSVEHNEMEKVTVVALRAPGNELRMLLKVVALGQAVAMISYKYRH